MLGKLIVIDGADGSGKATQARLLVDRLTREGKVVELLDFPRYTDNTLGALIRECLDGKRGNFMEIDPRIASVLYAADRYESKSRILEWLEEGKIVVLDRYVSANMMHQGAKIHDEEEAHTFLDWLDHMEHGVFGLPRPDTIVYLDVPYAVRLALITQDGSRTSIDVAESHEEHQVACEQRAKSIVSKSNTWNRIDCTEAGRMRAREEIHDEIYEHIMKICG